MVELQPLKSSASVAADMARTRFQEEASEWCINVCGAGVSLRVGPAQMTKSLTVAARSEQEKAESVALGVYVHIPFCSTTCEYCAFYQVRPEGDDLARYLKDVATEFLLVETPLRAGTVFWGGGTPGLLPAKHIATLCALVRGNLAAAPTEWTVEMAPGTVTRDRLAALRDGGVTRISLGVQSFRPELLSALGRRHTREQAVRAYELVRAAGFASVNLDMIFAVPGQDAAGWRSDLAAAVALGPDHISTYCLTFEEDTALYVKLAQGKVARDAEQVRRSTRRHGTRSARRASPNTRSPTTPGPSMPAGTTSIRGRCRSGSDSDPRERRSMRAGATRIRPISPPGVPISPWAGAARRIAPRSRLSCSPPTR